MKLEIYGPHVALSSASGMNLMSMQTEVFERLLEGGVHVTQVGRASPRRTDAGDDAVRQNAATFNPGPGCRRPFEVDGEDVLM